MEGLMQHVLEDSEYVSIITILDYEARVNRTLAELCFPVVKEGKNKVIVDLALKSGMDEYRFVEYELDAYGKVVIGSNRYVAVMQYIEKLANDYLKETYEILQNSILTETMKNKIMDDTLRQ